MNTLRGEATVNSENEAELRRINDDLKIEILALKEKFHKQQILDEEARLQQRQSYDAIVAALQKEIQELKQNGNKSQDSGSMEAEALDRLKSELQECRSINSSLEKEIQNFRDSELRYSSEKSHLLARVAKLESQLKDCTNGISQYKSICERQMQRIAELERLGTTKGREELEHVKVELASMTSKLQNSQRAEHQLRQEVARLESHSRNVEQKLDETRNEYGTHIKKYQELTKSLGECRDLVDRLQAMRVDLEKKNESLKLIIESKEHEVANLKRALGDVQEELKQLVANDNEEEVSELKVQLEMREKQLEGAVKALSRMREDVEFLHSKSKKDKVSIAELTRKISTLEEEKTEKEAEYNKNFQQLKDEWTSCQCKLVEAEEKLQGLVNSMSRKESEWRKETEALRADLENLQAQKDEVSKALTEMKDNEIALMSKEKEMKSLIERLTSALARERDEAKSKTEALTRIEKKLSEESEMKACLEKELMRLKDALNSSLADGDIRVRTAMETASFEISKVREELTLALEEIRQAKTREEDLKRLLAEREESLLAREQELSSLSEKLLQAHDEVVNLRTEIVGYQVQVEKNSIKNELQPDTGIESDGVKLVFDQELQHIKEELEAKIIENQELIVKNAKLERLAKEINGKYKNTKESYASYLRSMEARNQTAVIEIVTKHDQIQSKCIQLQNEVDRLKSDLEDSRRKKEKYKSRSKELANEIEEMRRSNISTQDILQLIQAQERTVLDHTSFQTDFDDTRTHADASRPRIDLGVSAYHESEPALPKLAPPEVDPFAFPSTQNKSPANQASKKRKAVDSRPMKPTPPGRPILMPIKKEPQETRPAKRLRGDYSELVVLF